MGILLGAELVLGAEDGALLGIMDTVGTLEGPVVGLGDPGGLFVRVFVGADVGSSKGIGVELQLEKKWTCR